jgi:hypothetical protein
MDSGGQIGHNLSMIAGVLDARGLWRTAHRATFNPLVLGSSPNGVTGKTWISAREMLTGPGSTYRTGAI